jgi:hypothetical protein
MARCIRRLFGHAIVATEIVCGLAFTAILTSLTSVRFYGSLRLAAGEATEPPSRRDPSQPPMTFETASQLGSL